MSFTHKVVIVTGAGSGIGAATALMFCKEGASVALVDKNEAKLKNVSEQCSRAGGKHVIITADVANDIDAKKIINQTVADFGKLDVLVNNAGIMQEGSFLDGNLMDSYDNLISINLRAPIHLTTLAAPHLSKTKGNIVNISSAAGLKVSSLPVIAYSVSKAGLIHFTKGAAAELAASGVRVNVICPGPVKTEILGVSNTIDFWDEIAKFTLLNRVLDAGEIADLILFIASDKARGVTGSNFVIDAGYLIRS